MTTRGTIEGDTASTEADQVSDPEEQVRKLLRKWVYAHYSNQPEAAKRLGTSTAYLNHVLNGRSALTEEMAKVLGLKREVVVRYKTLTSTTK